MLSSAWFFGSDRPEYDLLSLLLPSQPLWASEATSEEPAQGQPSTLPQGPRQPLPFLLDMVFQNPILEGLLPQHPLGSPGWILTAPDPEFRLQAPSGPARPGH